MSPYSRYFHLRRCHLLECGIHFILKTDRHLMSPWTHKLHSSIYLKYSIFHLLPIDFTLKCENGNRSALDSAGNWNSIWNFSLCSPFSSFSETQKITWSSRFLGAVFHYHKVNYHLTKSMLLKQASVSTIHSSVTAHKTAMMAITHTTTNTRASMTFLFPFLSLFSFWLL